MDNKRPVGLKKSFGADESRRKRDELFTGIRKEKMQESLAKRRLQDDDADEHAAREDENSGKLGLAELVAQIRSDNIDAQFTATAAFRKLLSKEVNPPIDEVINCGVIPRFVEFLSYDHMPRLQFEAAWALTNVASGTSEHTREVLKQGAVPMFVRLIGSPSEDVREQVIWALGNIAGDSPECRNFILQMPEALPAILTQLVDTGKLSLQRNATWTLSNLCRGKPPPNFEIVRHALPTLAQLLFVQDAEVLTDACWALSYLSDGSNNQIQAVIEVGVAQRMVELLMHPLIVVQTPALRTVGNIVTGDDVQTQSIINCSVLPCLLVLLQSSKKSIRKEACWTISNITAGNSAQIQAVIEAGIFSALIELLSTAEFDIKKEAAWAISNATSGGTPQQIKYLVSQNCIGPMCDLLDCPDPKIVIVALDGLDNILRVGQTIAEENGQQNHYCTLVEEVGGCDKLEGLQDHFNKSIVEKVTKIIDDYFQTEDEDNNGANVINPGMDQTGNYTFGVSGVPSGGFNFGN